MTLQQCCEFAKLPRVANSYPGDEVVVEVHDGPQRTLGGLGDHAAGVVVHRANSLRKQNEDKGATDYTNGSLEPICKALWTLKT